MKRIFRTMPLAAVLLVAATGCSSAFRQPVVEFVNIRPTSIGLSGGSLVAEVRVENPNSFDLRTDSITYDLEFQDVTKSDPTWIKLTTGTIRDPIEIDSRNTRTIEIPISFKFADLGPAMKSVLDRGSLNYRIAGNVALRDPVSRKIPYRKQGTVSALSGIR